MLKIGSVYTDKNNINYKIICICKYNDDELVVFQKVTPVQLSKEFVVYCTDSSSMPQALKPNDFVTQFNPCRVRNENG